MSTQNNDTPQATPESAPESKGRKLGGWHKLAVDFGPLVLFLLGYFMPQRIGPIANGIMGTEFFTEEGNELFLAIALFIPAYVVAFVASLIVERRIAPMLLVNGVIVIVLGGLTLISGNKTLFYMKPTIIYALFAVVLIGGLLTERNFLKVMFDEAFALPDHAWRTLTWRFAGAFLVMAAANEVTWRVVDEATWVNIKIFGFTAAYLLFIISQGPFIAKHMQGEPGKRGKTVVDGPDDTAGVVDTQTSAADESPGSETPPKG